ncbi:AbiJ-NTD4 domain-containing protein [Thioalkalivibrio sp. HK1]|uniref:AbiJ-NTD4 domain-containing protein n=1 Tax=Thioalkalivibrio sp. HK1 TaxID=1469245 RepID=UPI0012DF0936|nr:hypothetical protein [Thioalkalivibrio sp. HK1]
MTFSERHGYAQTPPITIRESAPSGLRDAMIENAIECGLKYKDIRSMLCRIMAHEIDDNNWSEVPNIRDEVLDAVSKYSWYEVYDIIEEILRLIEKKPLHDRTDKYIESMNNLFIKLGIGWELKRGEGVVYRGNDAFQSATANVENDLQTTGRKNAASEIKEAIKDISRRPEPDITGAITHAMSALECVSQNILGSKNTLGKIANSLELPKPLDEAVNKLYGFASQHGRHVSEESRPTSDDAELVVHISCAICTYLTKKHSPSTKEDDMEF